MTYVYILSDYEEHGAQNVTATLDRSRLEAMIDEDWNGWDEAKTELRSLLSLSDDQLVAEGGSDGKNLTDGWGGLQLHVVKLT